MLENVPHCWNSSTTRSFNWTISTGRMLITWASMTDRQRDRRCLTCISTSFHGIPATDPTREAVSVGSSPRKLTIGQLGKAVPSLPAPVAEDQLLFLSKLQRVFAEGDFTATYKFALLIALADLAVELGADDGDPLVLGTRQLGERFIHLYWRHALPYGAGRSELAPGVLIQNQGAQAAVVSAIAAFREGNAVANAQLATNLPDYKALLARVTQTVSAQPLNYLQNFGGSTDEFLYSRAGPGAIELKAGIAYCLRRFHPLVQQLARSHWLEHIKGNRRNQPILGIADDLESFLFSCSRQSLLELSSGLRKLDGARCFYCGDGLHEADVDHFIPFSQYPRDLAHNFVLAHPGCNRSKSDTLAARAHLERWILRLDASHDQLAQIGHDAGIVVDARAAKRVASWGYASGHAAGGHAWRSPNQYEVIDASYPACFAPPG